MIGNYKFGSRDEGRGDAMDAKWAELVQSYRAALPDRDASAAFMPELWGRIEARRNQTTFFTRMSRALVTFAVAASVLLGILLSSSNQAATYFSSTYIDVLAMEHNRDLDPMHPDRISEVEQD